MHRFLLLLLSANLCAGEPADDAGLALAEPRLPVVTTWIGNTWGGWTGPLPARPTTGWAAPAERTVRMQPGVQGVAVAPDGTVVVVGRADGRGISLFRDGAMVGWHPLSQHHMHATGAVAADARYHVVAVRLRGQAGGDKVNAWGGRHGPAEGSIGCGVVRLTPDGLPAPFPGGDGWFGALRLFADGGSLTGLAFAGDRLFVSDPVAGRIRVLDVESMREVASIATADPGPLAVDGEGRLWMLRRTRFAIQEHAWRVNCGGEAVDGWMRDRWRRGKVIAAPGPVETQGVAGAAPSAIYASAIHHGVDSAYWATGFLPLSSVRLRIHLAEYQADSGERVFQIHANRRLLAEVDVAKQAGGKLRALVVEGEAMADERGTVQLQYRKVSGDGARLCGIEAIGRRQTSDVASPGEALAFGRDLAPLALRISFTASERPEDLACRADGSVLILDAGPDNQIKAYRPGTAAAVATIGVRGGVYAGPVRGRAAPDRLTYPLAMACASDGTVYVGDDTLSREDDIGGAALVAFAKDGSVRWRAEGYPFMDEPDWDRGDGSLVYPFRRLAVDLSKPAGDQWRSSAVTVDRFSFPWDPRLRHSALHRDAVWHFRLGERRLMALVGGGGIVLYRWDPARFGEIAIPCAAWLPNANRLESWPGAPLQGEAVWRDNNGDGMPQTEEYELATAGSWGDTYGSLDAPTFHGMHLDTTGALWTTHGQRGIRRLPLADKGPPGWDLSQARHWPAPACIARGALGRIAYDAARDRLYLSGPAPEPGPYTIAAQEAPDGRLVGDRIARFDAWMASASVPEPTWTAAIPFDSTRLRSRHTARDLPTAMTVEGDHIFVAATAFGRIRAWQADDGRFVGMIEIGPSQRAAALADDGTASADANALGLIDSAYSLRAWLKDGEYRLTYHDNFLNRTVLYRWRPGAVLPPAPAALRVRQVVSDPGSSLLAEWPAVAGASGYLVELQAATAGAPWREAARTTAPSATISGVPAGGSWFVRVRAQGSGGGWGDYSPVAWAATAGASAISVDFVGGGRPCDADEQAGSEPRLRWNSAAGGTSTAPLPLSDDRGKATGVTITWAGGRPAVNQGIPDQPGDRRMLRGQLHGERIVLSLAGIPYPRYDLLVHADQQRGRHARMRVQAGSRSVILADDANDDFQGWWRVPHQGHGNVAVLAGLSGADIEIILDGDPGAGACAGAVATAFLSGLQIVEHR